MRKLIGKTRHTTEVEFMGEKVEVLELSVNDVKTFQRFATENKDSEDGGLAIQRELIRMAVVDASDMTDEELDGFPLKELSKLAKQILTINGLDSEEVNEGGNAS